MDFGEWALNYEERLQFSGRMDACDTDFVKELFTRRAGARPFIEASEGPVGSASGAYASVLA